MKAVNVIMEEMLKHRGVEIGLWDINVMQYTSAVTLFFCHRLIIRRSKKVPPQFIYSVA